ncbi:MAG: hypothetical protein WDO68_25515 [Gammaproteobacteria bacterium]
MSSGKHDRQWASAGAAMALGCLPLAALALGGGGDAAFTTAVPAPPGCAAPGMNEPMAETLKGAPYSGVGTTEVVTTLADGNRITRTNTMHYFRDGAGRMRTEYQLAAIGPFVPQESQSIVTITDPVAGKRYVLHPSLKRADVFDLSSERSAASVGRAGNAILVGGVSTNIGAPAPGLAQSQASTKGIQMPSSRSGRGAPSMGTPAFAGASAPSEAGISRGGTPGITTAAGPAGNVFFATAGAVGAGCAGPNVRKAPQAVSIGERRIEGLKVTGSRLEFTINAGEVGNDQPITVRTDQWFSADLGVVVSSTHHDPMIGETTYRLEQINRADPDAALFAVPADYTKSPVER